VLHADHSSDQTFAPRRPGSAGRGPVRPGRIGATWEELPIPAFAQSGEDAAPSDNQGGSWQAVTHHLPPIYVVRFGGPR
jgi:hypothetical protein